MKIDFGKIKEITMPGMNGGIGTMSAKMYSNEKYRIIKTIIHPGSSIGMHIQKRGDDINYIVSGNGKAICDGIEEKLKPGVMHICWKGSEHSVINTGDEDLIIITVVSNI